MTSIISRQSNPLSGEINTPGDKSISHRALMIGAMAVGETVIEGLLEGDDVLATAAALRQLGAEINHEDGVWRVNGRGVGGLGEPKGVLDMGNSGTGARLLMGILASHPFTSILSGDASLSSRPMERVMAPLKRMGASFTARSGGLLPLTVQGVDDLAPISEPLRIASAQVKSAILFAGLNTVGQTTVIEPHPSRDHTEKLLSYFGAEISVEEMPGGGRTITITGYPELTARQVIVPSDISSAAFPLVAAVLIDGSELTLARIGLNKLRSGILDCLIDMGADIKLTNESEQGGEPIADLTVKRSNLTGIVVPAARAPSMIDEYPILAMAAACADGDTHFEGVGELRVKECDRLSAIARGLAAAGVGVDEGDDSLTIHGQGRAPAGNATIAAELDHRIAMSFLVLGMVADDPIIVDDGAPIDTSFPGFVDLMNGLGGQMAFKNP